jgi:hypothetical protein
VCQESDRAADPTRSLPARSPTQGSGVLCGCPVRDVILDRETQARTSRIESRAGTGEIFLGETVELSRTPECRSL